MRRNKQTYRNATPQGHIIGEFHVTYDEHVSMEDLPAREPFCGTFLNRPNLTLISTPPRYNEEINSLIQWHIDTAINEVLRQKRIVKALARAAAVIDGVDILKASKRRQQQVRTMFEDRTFFPGDEEIRKVLNYYEPGKYPPLDRNNYTTYRSDVHSLDFTDSEDMEKEYWRNRHREILEEPFYNGQ